MPLTLAKIKALEPQPKRRMIADGAGLWLEVHPSGRMAWYSRYTLRRRAGKCHLGRWPHLNLADARRANSDVLAAVRAGKSPAELRQAEKQAELRGLTVRAFTECYFREQLEDLRKDLAPVRRYFERDIWPVIGDTPISAVDVDALRGIIWKPKRAGHDSAALALRNLLKRLWDYALVCGAVEKNPLDVIKAKFVGTVRSRTRALEPREIGVFLRALDAAKIKARHKIALRLILLTLTRKSELRLARWEHIDWHAATWEIPAENSKTGVAQIVYLSRQAVALFAELEADRERSGFVFPMAGATLTPMAASTLNRALACVPANLAHFTVHDLRRTAATNLAELEYSTDWIEKALNHNKKGVAGIYNRAQYAAQRRTMLQAWADWLDQRKAEQ